MSKLAAENPSAVIWGPDIDDGAVINHSPDCKGAYVIAAAFHEQPLGAQALLSCANYKPIVGGAAIGNADGEPSRLHYVSMGGKIEVGADGSLTDTQVAEATNVARVALRTWCLTNCEHAQRPTRHVKDKP